LKHRKHKIEQEGNVMKKIQKFAPYMVAAVILLSLGGCAGMSSQDKNTAIGAGVGVVGGAILTGGSTMGTVGGAAVGGVIGHEVSKDKDK
jgi:osmotically inducible lipoprotein OsmB